MAIRRREVSFAVLLLTSVSAACSSGQARPSPSSDWLVSDPEGRGTITCQKTGDEGGVSDVLSCEANNMEIRTLGRPLTQWTVRVNRNTGEPCCRAEAPCCLKGTGCPCELFDLMRAKNALPKWLSRNEGVASEGLRVAERTACAEGAGMGFEFPGH